MPKNNTTYYVLLHGKNGVQLNSNDDESIMESDNISTYGGVLDVSEEILPIFIIGRIQSSCK